MTISSETIQSIARDLYDARVGVYTVPYVSPRLPERDLDAAYAISTELAALRERHLGVRRVGRKVGLTNPNVQKRVGISEPGPVVLHAHDFTSGSASTGCRRGSGYCTVLPLSMR